MKTTNPSQIVVPALKACMGDWNYYIGFMQFRDILERISIAEEIHQAKSLKEMLQRGLRERAPEIATYLKMQPQRFFNALVIGAYGGNPQWYEVGIKESPKFSFKLPKYVEGALGFLVLTGDETLFAIDGQHRVAGIRKAVEEDKELSSEEVAVIFLKGVSASNRDLDPDGFERTRRLFTTLNSRAKSVSKKDIIALDEDDIIAIITRRLIEEHELFEGSKIYSKGVKSIPPSNTSALITIVGLYDALDQLLKDDVESLELQKRKRPTDDKIEFFYKKTCEWYDYLTNAFQPLREFKEAPPEIDIARNYRGRQGGHLLFRPIGFVMIHKVTYRLKQTSCTIKEAIKRISKNPMDLSKPPWVSLLWDNVNKRMLYASERQKVAEKVLFYQSGGDLSQMQSSLNDLKEELSGLLNKPVKKINIRRYAAKI